MMRDVLVCASLAIVLSIPAIASQSGGKALTVESSAAGKQYLAYGGKPLLAFGPGDESRLISRNDLEAVRRWAKWQKDDGMNLLRAYPTSVPGAINWQTGPQPTPVQLGNAVHPFKQKDGKWDVDAWNDEYFKNMSRFFSVLAEYGIVVHLQLWQVVWFKEDKPERWAQNYVNPVNNCNEWTRAYPHGRDYMNAPSDSAAGRHRREWVRRVLGSVKGHGNVWIDVLNELENAGIGDLKWSREVVSWIREWEKANGQKLLVGVDMCNYRHSAFAEFEKDYDLVILTELHRDEALRATKDFNKPIVSVRSSDGSNRMEDLLFLNSESVGPQHQMRYRTLCYRSVFSGLQSIGAYWKPEVSEASYADMKDWPVYARALRKFWGKIGPFWPDLVVDDSVVGHAVTPHAYGMKSDRLYAAYLECGPHTAGNQYPASTVSIKCPFQSFRVEILDPRTGRTRLGKGTRAGDDVAVQLPEFTDDLVVLVWRK